MVNVWGDDNGFKQVIRFGKKIPQYYVSENGEVYSTKTNRILKATKAGNKNNYNNQYDVVSLQGTTTHVHRIVMETWRPIDEYPPVEVADTWNQVITQDMVGQPRVPAEFKEWVRRTAWVDHVEGNKDDNRAQSLAWVTPAGNNHHLKKKNNDTSEVS